jgi:hypothetical protein
MNGRKGFAAVSSLLWVGALALHAGTATAAGPASVAGTYTIVSVEAFGDNARGVMTLGRDGRYSLILARQTLPKFAAGTRTKSTPEESKAIVDGSIAHFGKYTVNDKDKTITFNIEASTYPNWDGAVFKRALKVSGDTLTYTNAQPSDGGKPNDVVWKRVK